MKNHSSVVVFVVSGLIACASARRGELVGAPLPAGSARGQSLFGVHCDQCHPGGGAGLGPALNNKPMPGPFIHAQVRFGVGAMPGFTKAVLDEESLTLVVAYVEALHDAPHAHTPAASTTVSTR
ncbi:MAG: cytochrome c [Deltaproteobacteria bacterium]|nr:cytochrome c [Deltaproteobacteria bacterium]